LAFYGCGPKPPTPPDQRAKLPAPYNLNATGARGRVTLAWSIDRSSKVLISGYNIYLAESLTVADMEKWPEISSTPHNDFPYPGDTDGDINRESILISGLVDGTTYLAAIRTVGPGGILSAPSDLVSFILQKSGEFIISANQLTAEGGYNFEDGISVPGRDPRSDIYLYATPDRIGLSSPHRLGAGLRRTKFRSDGENASASETIVISKGKIIQLESRRGLAQLRIVEIIGAYPDIAVRIKYSFVPRKP